MTTALTPYLGAKRSPGTLLQVLGQIPPHNVFIETHLGTGAVINAKPPSGRDIGIEIDTKTIATFGYKNHIEVINGDCLAFLRSFDYMAAGKVAVYADPPYVQNTRTSKNRYRHDYTNDDHRALLATLGKINANVIISGYPSRLYDDLLPKWRTHEFQAMTRGGVRTEKLWMNFESPAPFWHTQAGVNAQDRRRIKRLAARWQINFANRPALEQMAILAALVSTMNEEKT